MQEKKKFDPPKVLFTASAGSNGLIIRGDWNKELGTLPLVAGELEEVNKFLAAEAAVVDEEAEDKVYFVGCVEEAQAGMQQKDMYWLIQRWLYLAKQSGKYRRLTFFINQCGNKKYRSEIARRLNNLLH